MSLQAPMRCRLSDLFCGAALLAVATLPAGCQSGGGDALEGAQAAAKPTVTASELRAYCPPVGLREGTAFFTSYEKPAPARAAHRAKTAAPDAAAADAPDADAAPKPRVIYQTSITDVTRSCTHENGVLSMKVGVAGKVVPGPAAKAGTVTLPIRIAVLAGEQVLYSNLKQYSVQVSNLTTATQFLYAASDISFPDPNARGVRAFAGFDEGPPKDPTATAESDGTN